MTTIPMDRESRSAGWCATLCHQITLLLGKNWAMHKHNLSSTLLQIFLPAIMSARGTLRTRAQTPLCPAPSMVSHARAMRPGAVIIIGIFRVDDKFNVEGFNRYTFELTMQPTVAVQPMPTCTTFSMPSCTTPLAIVHEPADFAAANAVSGVVSALLRQNTQILPADLVYYNSSDDLNAAMVAAPLSVLAALHFPPTFNLDTNPSVTVQYNRTAYCLYGSQHCTTPWRDVQLPVQSAVERAILTEAAGGTDVTLTPGYARFPNPDVSATNARDFGEYVDAIYVLLACIFPLVVQMNQLVQEKELKLKLLMRISGVKDTAMWLSWWIFFLALAIIPSLIWVRARAAPRGAHKRRTQAAHTRASRTQAAHTRVAHTRGAHGTSPTHPHRNPDSSMHPIARPSDLRGLSPLWCARALALVRLSSAVSPSSASK